MTISPTAAAHLAAGAFLAGVALAPTCQALTLKNGNGIATQFERWALEHGIRFRDNDEYERRLGIFQENYERVLQHNANPERTYSLGLTPHAHMRASEFVHREREGGCAVDGRLEYERNADNDELPPEVDWRVKKVFSPVQSETSWCRSSYALATAATVESYVALDQGALVQLSYQQILDCSEAQGNRHCDGGSHINAYKYIKSVVGLETFKSYPPSTNRTQDCHYDSTLARAAVTSIVGVGVGKSGHIAEQDMAETLAVQGPLTVGFNMPDDFHLYTSGVYFSTDCSKDVEDMDMSLVLVGYNTTDADHPYWIARAAFGPDFGLDGHVLIAKGRNVCGLARCAAYPQVKVIPPPTPPK